MPKRAFTLVELMIAATILSIGIVMVLRSFLSNASVLDTGGNRIRAVHFLANQMAELELLAMTEGKLEAQSSQEETTLKNRKATFSSEVVFSEDELIAERLSIATLGLSWKETNIERERALGMYFMNQEEEES